MHGAKTDLRYGFSFISWRSLGPANAIGAKGYGQEATHDVVAGLVSSLALRKSFCDLPGGISMILEAF